jgi:hypothetical protein
LGSVGLLSCLLRGFERSLLCGLLCSLLGGSLRVLLRCLLTGKFLRGLKRGLAGGSLCCQSSCLLRRKLRCSVPLLCDSRGLGNTHCLSILARFQSFLFHGLLNSLPRLFARLRPRRREVAVLGSVQIRPRIEGCHIFRRLIWVGKRVALSHCLSLHVARRPISRHGSSDRGSCDVKDRECAPEWRASSPAMVVAQLLPKQ